MAGICFMVYIWVYFYMLFYKFNDFGIVWNDYLDKKLNDKIYFISKFSFEFGIGDVFDDWYVLYVDFDFKLLQVVVYIVIVGQDQVEVEKDLYVIEYFNY